MPVTIKATASSTPSSSTCTHPAGIVAGDLIIYSVNSYNTNSGSVTGTGVTSVYSGGGGTGGWGEYISIFKKTATGTESGTAVTWSSGSYAIIHVLVLSGHHSTSPIEGVVASATGSSTAFSTPTLTIANTSLPLGFVAHMSTNSGQPSEFTTSWGTLVQSQPSSNYARHSVYKRAEATAGVIPAFTGTNAWSGGDNVAVLVAIRNGNATPTASSLSPSTFKDNRTAPARFSWTYSDAESNPQYRYEIGYKLKGSTSLYEGTATTLSYTGAAQTYTVPDGVTQVKIKAWGANGFNPDFPTAGRGGYAEGSVAVTPGEVLNVYVGQQGLTNTYSGSFNGGGGANGWYGGGGGGGASDVRRAGTALSNRIIVAGGGGGQEVSPNSASGGGHGGGTSGGVPSGSGIGVANQTTGYSLGVGEASGGQNYYSGAGGGGYYGGYRGNTNQYGATGGGGGSSYITGLINGSTTEGLRTGDGQVQIIPVNDWNTVTNVSSNAYHDFATGTFTLGEEYEWRLRLDDNLGGGWSPYYTAAFTSGTSAWIYGPETKSSGANIGTNVLAAHGDFEASNSIALGVWESNPAFGSFIQSTVARTTTKPDTGSYSLEVTLPTLTATQATVANCSAPGTLVYGKTYRASARVWMDAAGPNFRLDMLYQGGQVSPVCSIKGQWVTVTSVFTNTSSNGNQFPAIKTEGAATAGQKMWIDNFTLYEVTSSTSDVIPPIYFSEDFELGYEFFRNDPAVDFGYVGPTAISRTTTKADTGSASMMVTFPTAAKAMVANGSTFLANKVYRIKARVWVPTGGPNVKLGVFDNADATSSYQNVAKDQWVDIEHIWTGAGFLKWGILAENTTNGQVIYVDNVTITDVALEPGEYYVQVRTTDHVGYGPWSTVHTAVVKGPPLPPTSIALNPERVGGNITVTWTFNPTESDPQTKYQIQYRKKT